jgi:hypothetical protein
MGTFHQGKSELHGITVVVDTLGPEIYIGRCDDVDGEKVILLDVDRHREGDGGKSKEDYVRQAANLGFWPRHKYLTVPRDQVVSIRRLGEV